MKVLGILLICLSLFISCASEETEKLIGDTQDRIELLQRERDEWRLRSEASKVTPQEVAKIEADYKMRLKEEQDRLVDARLQKAKEQEESMANAGRITGGILTMAGSLASQFAGVPWLPGVIGALALGAQSLGRKKNGVANA